MMCPIDPTKCTCIGHRVPGVYHIAPCCDEPHVPDRVYDMGFLSLPQEIQDEVNQHAAEKYAEEKRRG